MKVFLIILFIASSFFASGQENRLLFHYSRYKQAVFNKDDVITFRVKGSRDKISWYISDITDSTIVSGFDAIKPDSINAIYIDKKTKAWFPFRRKYTRILLTAGIGFFFIDWANTGEVDRTTVIVSGSLLAAAGISKLIIKPYIKLKGRRKLVILR